MLVNVNNGNDDSGYDWSPSRGDEPLPEGNEVKVTFANGQESDNANFDIYEVDGKFIAHHIATRDEEAWTLGPVELVNGKWTEISSGNDGSDDNGGPGYTDGDHGDGIDRDDFLAEPSVTNLPITLTYDAGNVWSREDGTAGVFTQSGSVSGTVAFALLDSSVGSGCDKSHMLS